MDKVLSNDWISSIEVGFMIFTFLENEIDAQAHYRKLAHNISGFEQWLCHFLTLYPSSKSVFCPLNQPISIFLFNEQSPELTFYRHSSFTDFLYFILHWLDIATLSSLQIYYCHIMICALVLKWLVPWKFRVYCSTHAKLKLSLGRRPIF